MEQRLTIAFAADANISAERLAKASEYAPPPPSGGLEKVASEMPAPDVETRTNGGSSLPPSESINVWPDEAAEAAFISESRGRGEPAPAPVAMATAVRDEASDQPLPQLDELVQRIPSETRELLDELFRAKFVTVRRVPQDALKA